LWILPAGYRGRAYHLLFIFSEMIAGIDVGARMTKVVILEDTRIIAKMAEEVGYHLGEIRKVFERAVMAAGTNPGDIGRIGVTGSGKELVDFADLRISEITSAAKGIGALLPEVRTLVEVGAEGCRVIRCERGKVINFLINDRCAAGTGSFFESMAGVLELGLEELGEISLSSKKAISISMQCVVFAESEVVGLMHARVPKEEIVWGICKAVAERIGGIVKGLGIAPPVGIAGGVAKNRGLVKALEDILQTKILVPSEPEFICAHGVGLISAERSSL
jgi:benzoyl-CoA reductase subunit D